MTRNIQPIIKSSELTLKCLINKWKWLTEKMTELVTSLMSSVMSNNQATSSRPTLHLSAYTEQRELRISPWVCGLDLTQCCWLQCQCSTYPGWWWSLGLLWWLILLILKLHNSIISYGESLLPDCNFSRIVQLLLIYWTLLVPQGVSNIKYIYSNAHVICNAASLL